MKIKIILTLLAIVTWQSVALPEKIVLFRHAEKMTGKNPHLTDEGIKRAKRLTIMLAPYKPTSLFSTGYNRTQQTITPLAEHTKLAVLPYNPRELPAFAETLRNLSGTIVVAGHSNTTPELIELLSGHVTHISETEFDKVFVLTPTKTPSTLHWQLDRLSSN
ncbi:hypothetical protein BGP78_21415 [Pseudoalteromonas sp. MSK9-3]|uniref:histidine phosphatase family protein n=1 Tax=Pseudoalteromonas sp. MSK9-3 TaxID=1897633 RepID=UPI000ECA22BE|nr:histidine phosphatase family protein [Pseudoalteromonas sp. MSK9-3]RJE71044.1 hypothetical protein BGP78_21415 [Pseudoalteromonas sp. MSK9-3]